MLLLQRAEEMEGGGGPNPGICSSSPSDWQAGVHFAATLPSERWGGGSHIICWMEGWNHPHFTPKLLGFWPYEKYKVQTETLTLPPHLDL